MILLGSSPSKLEGVGIMALSHLPDPLHRTRPHLVVLLDATQNDGAGGHALAHGFSCMGIGVNNLNISVSIW